MTTDTNASVLVDRFQVLVYPSREHLTRADPDIAEGASFESSQQAIEFAGGSQFGDCYQVSVVDRAAAPGAAVHWRRFVRHQLTATPIQHSPVAVDATSPHHHPDATPLMRDVDMPYIDHKASPFAICDAATGTRLPDGWTGLCVDWVGNKQLWFVSQAGDTRAYTAMRATDYGAALQEIEDRNLLGAAAALELVATDSDNCRVYYRQGSSLMAFQRSTRDMFDLYECESSGEPLVVSNANVTLNRLPDDYAEFSRWAEGLRLCANSAAAAPAGPDNHTDQGVAPTQ